MKIAIVSDEIYPVHNVVIEWLKNKGHEVTLYGALQIQENGSWVKSAEAAARSILENLNQEGIFFCWTGTGVSMVANRFQKIRAALCFDSETARAARIWNHANVLVLSNRLLSQDIAKEILSAWFEEYDKTKGFTEVQALNEMQLK